MTSKGQEDSLPFRWTAPKGLLTIGLFLAPALISEFIIVSFFVYSGLTDIFALKFFAVTISPLFHLLPLAVIVVLVLSWIYLTKHMFMEPRVISPAKVSKISRRRPRGRKTRVKSTSIMGIVKKSFQQN